MSLLRALALAVVLTMVAACGAESDSAEESEPEPDCPSQTSSATTSSATPSIDPRCVVETVEDDEVPSDPVEWTGTLESDGNAGGCLASWNGEISFTVQPEGEVTGVANISTSGQPGCTVIGGAAGTAYDEEFDVQGRLSGDTFDLEFVDPTDNCLGQVGGGVSIFCWGVPGGSVERVGDTVAGTFSTELGATSFETTLELRCETCSS